MLTLILALVVQLTFAQEKQISGTVSDKEGPLPGVSVLIKGTTSGAETDFDGKYTITAKTGDILVFSYLGYTTLEKTVGNSNTIDAILEEDSNVLEEVVVTGYTAQKKSAVTGSIVQLSAEKVNDLASASVDQALQGKVAGLSVTQTSGTPGATANIRIRGISSINASNEPLYVIDGVPVTNNNVSSSGASSSMSALASIPQSNIKSISVLKDATATSQYGARGANGVIIITTKSGRAGKTRFSASSYYGVQNDATTGPVPLTAAERFELMSEAYFNDGFFSSVSDSEAWLLANRGEVAAWEALGRPESNWSDVIRNKNAQIQEHNISASGGGSDHSFFASVGYFKQEGTVIGSEYERISASLNVTKDLSSKLRFSSSNSASYSYQDAFLERSAYFEGARTVKYFLSPFVQPYDQDGEINLFGGSLPNPLIITRDNINDNRFTRILSNNSLSWKILDNLTYEGRVGVDLQLFNAREYSNRNYGYGAPTSGDAYQSFRNNVTWTLQNKLVYDFNLGDDHELNATAIQEYQVNRSYFLSGSGDQFAADGLHNLQSAGNIVSLNSSFFDFKFGRYLALAHYGAFDNKYVVDASFTYEASSRFSSNNRWGEFYSVGAAWNIHKEDFLANSKVIDNLKLRASYGTTGNAGIGAFEYETLLGNSDYNTNGALAPSGVGNADLSWEKSKTLDLGVDFSVFDGVFSGSVAYFNRLTQDLLFDVPLPQSSGDNSIRSNIGEISNKGFEFEFNANIVSSEDFNFNIGGNFATVKNNVEELALDPNGEERTITTTLTRVESGYPIRGWYMPTWAGVNTQTGEEEWYVNGVDGATTNNFNDAEAVWQGENSVPTFTAGLNLHVDFKGVYLDANGYYAGGFKIYEGWHRYLNQTNGFPTFAFSGFNTLMDRWQQPGDEARFGKATSSFTPWQRHSKFLHDGDFFRLRAVTLGYDLPTSAIESIGLSGLKFYVRANNPYTWQKAKDNPYDPEVDAGGQTGLETPPIKSVMFGLNLKF